LSFEVFVFKKHEEFAKDIKNINIIQLINNIINEEIRFSINVETFRNINKIFKLFNTYYFYYKLKRYLKDIYFKLYPKLKFKKVKKNNKKSKNNNKGKSNNKDKKEDKKEDKKNFTKIIIIISIINNNNIKIQDIKSKIILDFGTNEHYIYNKN
jgi:hypothetical protein